MERERQDFVIFGVERMTDGWDIHLGPNMNDPWLSIPTSAAPVPPEVGDIVTVLLPKVVGFTKVVI
jgi:hypothetical protein